MIDTRLEKSENDKDCRALAPDFYKRFLAKDNLGRFVELVRKHEELELLFRGNSSDGGTAVIYRNNGAMFTIKSSNTVSIDPNYLRYDVDWEKHIEILRRFYSFSDNQKPKVDGSTCSLGGPVQAALSEEYLNNLDNIYNLLSLIFYRHFDYSGVCKKDQFREYINKNNKGTVDSLDAGPKKRMFEKIRQQQLFRQIKEHKKGYFIYDLEFAQKDDQSDKKNKPDMQALRFDETGKPVAWVLVEVKSTKGAFNGTSSLDKHIQGMQDYCKPGEFLENRKREAYLLLHQYRELELIDIDEAKLKAEYFDALTPEIILIFTDEAIAEWEGKKNDLRNTGAKGISHLRKETRLLDDKSKAIIIKNVEKIRIPK